MRRSQGRRWAWWLPGLVLAWATGLAQAEPGLAPGELAQRVDALLAAERQERGWPAPGPADDARFLRRAWLDLCGTIPRVGEVRAYLADPAPDKRPRLVARLCRSPAFYAHLAATWRRILVPDDDNLVDRAARQRLETWLSEHFAAGRGYDHLVAEVLVAEGDVARQPAALFFTSRQLDPAALAAATARVFLGVQVDCAQCHEHPFDSWKQGDFWGYAAFFARLRFEEPGGRRTSGGRLFELASGEVTLPEQSAPVAPRFLGELAPAAVAAGRRQELAIWLVGRDNPFLARAAVNRVWAQLFGRGLVHPVDDWSPRHPPEHPQVLEELVRAFVAGGYDLPALVEALARTEAYAAVNLASSGPLDHLPAPGAPLPASLVRVKPLTGEQVLGALERLALVPWADEAGANDAARQVLRDDFLTKFRGVVDADGAWRAGVPQVLTLLNGSLVAELIDPARCHLLAATDVPGWSAEERLETLVLAAWGRPPTRTEAAALLAHVERASNPTGGWADVLWVLVNSAEFLFCQ